MSVFLIVVLFIVLLVALRALWRQNRALDELRNAIRSNQPLLKDQANDYLPAWSALTDAVNHLIVDNSDLRQQRTGQLTQLEATLGNLREAVLIVDDANYIHLANRAMREIFPGAIA